MKTQIVKPKILFYDIETTPLKAYIWGCGKQYISHKQLDTQHSQYGIICINYCWNDKAPVQCIDWGYDAQDTKKVIQEFDAIISQSDWSIGKNSDRFDTKMINAARMLHGLPGMPAWTKYTDDLEMQMRRYFRLPSQSLDYISAQLGLGGKIQMEFQDWIDIVEKHPTRGLKAYKKMCFKYGSKDVYDLRTLWNKLSEHFDPKFNMATWLDRKLACKHCGSQRLGYDQRREGLLYPGVRSGGKIMYQEYKCRDCHKYAGRVPLSQLYKKQGRIG